MSIDIDLKAWDAVDVQKCKEESGLKKLKQRRSK